MDSQLVRGGSPELTLAEAQRLGLGYSTYIQNPQDPNASPGWRYAATLESAREISLEETDPGIRLIHDSHGTIIERHISHRANGAPLGDSGVYRGKFGMLNESAWSILPAGLLLAVPAAAISTLPALMGQENDPVLLLGRVLAIFFGGGFVLPIIASKIAEAVGFRSLNRRIFRVFEEITGERASAVKFRRDRFSRIWAMESLSGNYELTYSNLHAPRLEWRRTTSRRPAEISPVDIREITA